MPGYQDIATADIPELSTEKGSLIRVLAGDYKGQKGAVTTQSVKPQFFDVHLVANESLNIATEPTHNGFVYVYHGDLEAAGEVLSKVHLALLSLASDLVLDGKDGARAIFVSGEPINEPVVQYGPFVMNSQEEINQALVDYQQGVLTQ